MEKFKVYFQIVGRDIDDEDSFDYELWDYMEDFFNCRLTREE